MTKSGIESSDWTLALLTELSHNGPKSSYEAGLSWSLWGGEKLGILFWRELGGAGAWSWSPPAARGICNNFTVIRQRIFNQNKIHRVAGVLIPFTWLAVNMESVTAQVMPLESTAETVLTVRENC